MSVREIIAGLGTGLISGYVGTIVMERVSMKLYEWEPEEARRQEDEVRPGPPFQIAVEKSSQLLGIQLSEGQLSRLSMGLHYATGMEWGPVYLLLRRQTNLDPVTAGLVAGGTMSLIIDEGLTPLLGFSAPNRAYPLMTHLRGIAAHLAFGLGVAACAETIVWLGKHAGAQWVTGNCRTARHQLIRSS